VANAIDHGSGRDERLLVKIEAALRPADVIVSVSDTGMWQPGLEGMFTGRGRGHLIMQASVDEVDIDTSRDGTVVTLLRRRALEASQGAPR
jgi:anti-sigma regulatory factor (Ser/Thr protein kinase)